MLITKSLFVTSSVCPKAGWLQKHKPELANTNKLKLELGSEVGDLAMQLFGKYIEIPFDKPSVMAKQTEEILAEEKSKIICEASFLVDGLFCSADIIKVLNFKKKVIEIYEVKSTTKLKSNYLTDLAFQVYVLKKAGYTVEKASIIYVNKEYEYKKNLAITKLFDTHDLTDKVEERILSMDREVEIIRQDLDSSTPPECLPSENCHTPFDCNFFNVCVKLPEDKFSVFDLGGVTFKKKIECYNLGLTSFEDIVKEAQTEEPLVSFTPRTIQQMLAVINEKDYFDGDKIKEFISQFEFPLYFLDFETLMEPVPKYKGMKPYDQIPFQYSLHILESPDSKEIIHKEFLAQEDTDPRLACAKQLVKDIGSTGTVLAYNDCFEKTVIKKLAARFPSLEVKLMDIHSRIKDLMVPFQKGWYYKKEMNGSYSIKYVLPALFPDDPSLDYHSLDGVQNGTMAMNAFRNLSNMDEAEKQHTRESLLKYCCLDTYAMVKVYSDIIQHISEPESCT